MDFLAISSMRCTEIQRIHKCDYDYTLLTNDFVYINRFANTYLCCRRNPTNQNWQHLQFLDPEIKSVQPSLGLTSVEMSSVDTYLSASSVSLQLMHTEHIHLSESMSPLSSFTQFEWNDRMQLEHCKFVSGLQHCQQYKSCLICNKINEFCYFSDSDSTADSVKTLKCNSPSLEHFCWTRVAKGMTRITAYDALLILWYHKLTD